MTTIVSNQQKGFTYGEQIVMRPVVEDDLKELAQLMAECPTETIPWTLQRLKKKFEDKENPGLWGKGNRCFSVLRNSGGVVGYVREHEDENRGVYWNSFHFGDNLTDRDGLASDMLKAYLEFKQAWHNPLRISFDILRAETGKAGCLATAGYELELTQERKVLHLGQPEAQCTYTWFSEALKQSPGWDDPAIAD